ncbi:MAG: AAA family ATPase [Caldilineaceae bacterium]
MPQPLPVGLSTFSNIREGDYLYVDKTQHIYELIRYPSGIYFLARPRRFGKSLFVSMLEEIFRGNKAAFQNLWLYNSPYGWDEYPIIRIDFSAQTVKTAEELQSVISDYLEEIADDYALPLEAGNYQKQFRQLIRGLAKQSKQSKVVILIDEYDKPIIDNIEDSAEAGRIRDVLKSFYTLIKAMDRYLRFVFLTGITKFSRVGVFSGLNNLEDISMHPAFSTALGITEAELRRDFADYIDALAERQNLTPDVLLQQIRRWYNGFCFAEECESVYNPFSLLLLFKEQRFDNYWFASGTPTFLIKLIKERTYPLQTITEQKLGHLAFNTYEIENLEIAPLLLQTGYLTIKGYDKEKRLYDVGYPNYEVEDAFLTYLLGAYSYLDKGRSENYLWQLVDALQTRNLEQFFELLKIFFAQIPYNLQIRQEKYYQTIFYLIFTLIGLRVQAEVCTNQGRIDAVIELTKQIYIFEFKLDGNEQAALAQIKETEYYMRYRNKNKSLLLVGANFASQQRNVTGWVVETT